MACEVYYINGSFLIFNKDHALKLRENRIICRLIGCHPKNPYQVAHSGLPCFVTHYDAHMILETKSASFKILKSKENPIEVREERYLSYLNNLLENAERDLCSKRTSELVKRNVTVEANRIGPFDRLRFKICSRDLPDTESASLESKDMSAHQVRAAIRCDSDKLVVFKDLYYKGFFVGSGLKFGSDFLIYCGDPVRFHAQYAIRLVPSNSGGGVDMSAINYNEINALNRLCHAAKKTPLLATTGVATSVATNRNCVRYWTLPSRTHLTESADQTIFSEIIPTTGRESVKRKA